MANTKAAKQPVPRPDASDPDWRNWLAWAASATDGHRIGDVIRYGATRHTPMTVEILPPGTGRPRTVRFQEERDACKHGTLREALIGDGGLLAEHITNAKIAGDFYYGLCRLARVVAGVGQLDEIRESVDGYREEADRIQQSFEKRDLFNTLDQLRCWPYSKREINLWMAAMERRQPTDPPPAPPAPRPPLFSDGKGGEWTSITHLATYIRWGRDQSGVIPNDALCSGVVELGGDRWKASAWDKSTRDRVRRITTVLVRLPSLANASTVETGPFGSAQRNSADV